MCPRGMPVACRPLWQLAQVPAATPEWSNEVCVHVVVRWQESQEALVARWPDGIPAAVLPLWHETQVPGATLTCEKRAPAQVIAEL